MGVEIEPISPGDGTLAPCIIVHVEFAWSREHAVLLIGKTYAKKGQTVVVHYTGEWENGWLCKNTTNPPSISLPLSLSPSRYPHKWQKVWLLSWSWETFQVQDWKGGGYQRWVNIWEWALLHTLFHSRLGRRCSTGDVTFQLSLPVFSKHLTHSCRW